MTRRRNGERYEDIWKEKPNYSVTTMPIFLPQATQFVPGKAAVLQL